ncbi:MAG: GDP-mannose 4,6-dehydratase [Chloroflexi bacterium]|nr:GDP-mannose 4,6-dehydratase [Chloroflexota bacterium]
MPDNYWHGRSVLLTGAGGFVGSWLAQALIDRQAAVTLILRDEAAHTNLDVLGLQGRANVVRGSAADYQLVERALNEYEVDTCFHLAAQAIVGPANRSPLSTFESNIRGTWTILEACRQTGVTRVVVASSDKAYGQQPFLPYTEDSPLLGTAPYEVSKACTDLLARSYRLGFGQSVTVARCANIYGGGDFNFSRLVPGTVLSVLAGERPIIRSDGTPERDYLYVEDAVDAYLALGSCPDEAVGDGPAFNFGSARPISALSLVHRITQVCGRPDLQPDVRGAGPGHNEIDCQYVDSGRARAVLGWSPRLSLDDGLVRTVEWYRQVLSEQKAAA